METINWNIQKTPTNVDLLSVTYGKYNNIGLFVTVGRDNTVMTSRNGTKWTRRKTPVFENVEWYSITYGNNYFIAISSNGIIISSKNGVIWKVLARVSGTWFSITYSNLGLFVIVGLNNSVMTSIDGTNWILQHTLNGDWTSVTSNNSGFIVSVGITNSILSSVNGKEWITRKCPGKWTSICSNNNGLFIGVGLDNTIYSNDCIIWNRNKVIGKWSSVCSNNNGIFIGVGLDGFIMISTNGIDWNLSKVLDNDLYCITYSNDLDIFIAVGNNNIIRLIISLV